ncbi:TPA: hypothetical protein ACWS13_001448 [Escherichia coli]|uniref:hypothetical protein n=1 Tax=Enterobacteriaceae TaxID=543 RepID=UPI001EF917B2|nr:MULTISPECIES: hypothetical protein [Enterobacteriaceae]MDH7083420.1 hypothetical protein [Escherichia coli]MDH7097046.1 hypothetical protein [Escherichia coli]MDH7110634.1 hypothetical protein [Escherichia coli]MDH7119944.1 hypothetical protein [Escherichia coli]MDH7435078.1 hypothetical protein [Escherichia coli]
MATQTEVARHLSLTDRQLRRLQKLPGAPISNKRGQLDLDAWRDFYISYLRRSKNDVPDGDSEDDYEEKLLTRTRPLWGCRWMRSSSAASR